jgi:hypothetical protein
MEMMLCLKCCPRCETGALYESKDMYGSYMACLQCGYYLTEAQEVAMRDGALVGPPADIRKEASRELIGVGGGR